MSDTPSKRALSRREAIKALGVGGAAAIAVDPLLAQGPAQSSAHRVDVVIVGAGFAGMMAARSLIRSGKKVVVLEARNRVGGRAKPAMLAGHPIDGGAMWVGPTQTRLLETIKEYGLHTRPQFLKGKNILEVNGKRVTADGETAGWEAATQAECDRVTAELDRLSAQVVLEAPWTTPQAETLDRLTVEEWLKANTKDKIVLRYFESATRALFTADPYQMSFLYFLFYLRSGDNFNALYGFDENSAQAFLVNESMHQVAVKVAAKLGDAIRLETPVTAIAQDGAGVTVVSGKGEWRGDYAIVAVPLPLSVRMTYTPPLPSHRDALAQHMPMGSVIKYWVAYEKPFWRERGLNGLLGSDEPPSNLVAADTTPAAGVPGFLTAFIDAAGALEWSGRPMEERKKMIVDRIVSFLGPEAANPIDYEDQDWPSDPWSRGCFGASMGPGVMTTLGKIIREPHGRIHWAGSETSTRWMGYIDGAIRSGERAAAEILANYKPK
ncbi:MAG: flavin monoamine oxidase family protein [Acidobacteria bacterium]|nr:flavin monoamine oxidase family protein [Acidobacteriota bacterium]